MQNLMSLPVDGLRLTGSTLREQIARRTLLVFLRHLGCPLTREMVSDVRQAIAARPNFPEVIFICMGDCEQSNRFFDKFFPTTRVICDPNRLLYQAFDIPRASTLQMYGPMAWSCYLRTSVRGFAPGKTVGDMWQKPGLVLVEPPGKMVWEYRFDGIGDRVDFSQVPTE